MVHKPGLGLTSVLLVVALTLSGCAGGKVTVSVDAPARPATADDAKFDVDTGALDGVVTDEELQKVAGAKVAIAELKLQTSSAEDGSFSFSRLAPAKYTLTVHRLGYEQWVQQIRIEADNLATVRVELIAIAIVEPYHHTAVWDGHVTCSLGFGAPVVGSILFTEECGNGVSTPAGQLGRNPNNEIDYLWKITKDDDPTNLKTILVELDWTPASAAATSLMLYVAHNFGCPPEGCRAQMEYCGTSNYGRPVMKCKIDGNKTGIKDFEKELPWAMTARVWPAPSAPGTVLLEQDFTIFRTTFWGEPMPPEFTAVEE